MAVPSGPGALRRWSGVGVVLALVGLVNLLDWAGLKVPNPPALLVVGVVFACFRGGMAAGGVAALLALAQILWTFHRPGGGFAFTEENAVRVILWTLSLGTLVGLVGGLRRRLDLNLGALETQLEAARQHARLIQHYQDLVQYLPLGIIVYRLVDLEDETSLTLMDANPAAMAMVNLRLDEARGKQILELFPKAQESGGPFRFAQTVRLGRPQEVGEVFYGDERLPDRAYGVKAFPLPDQCVGVAFEDITERVRARQLKDDFVSMVSHELRTPLTSIRGALGLIGSGVLGALPEKAVPLADIASQNCDRLTRLINDLLDIQKIELNRLDFRYSAVELGDLVARAVEAHQTYADDYGIRLLVRDGGGGATVRADPDRMFQVLANLLSNAVKFSPEGGTVTLRIVRGGGHLRVEVEDRGPGIPRAVRHRIFEKFYQVGGEAAPRMGSGLGLSIAKALVERMGGSIGFETKEGEGTTFHVEFPEQVQAVSHVRQGPRILILEDDPDIATLLGLVLRQEGLGFDIARDAAEAKALLGSRSYAAMTVDLLLPGQGGLSLIRDLRQVEATRELPIVVVSAAAAEGKRELNGSAFGIVDWLDKPLDLDRLVHAVRRAVRVGVRPGKLQILHVEDDPDLVRVVSTLLEDLAETEPAGNLAEARLRMQARKPDLVILDLLLPDGHGFELLPDLDGPGRAPIPVILFSATEVPEEVLSRVAGAFLKAKSRPEELVSAIKSLML